MIALNKARSSAKNVRKSSHRTAKTERDLAKKRDRAQRILDEEIAYIPNDSFKERSAKRVILGKPLQLDVVPEILGNFNSRVPSHIARLCDAPLLASDEETTLFRRMNYLLFRAAGLRAKLSAKRPHVARLEETESLLEEASRVKNRIVAANVRLVVSIVKQLAPAPGVFEEMLSDGLLAMIRATEKFDFDRGFRFSTYATMVVRRQLYRSMKNDHRDRTRFTPGDPALMIEHPEAERDPRIGYTGWVHLNSALTAVMASLDDRERSIIRARFGFDTDGKKQTLQSLAKDLGVCKERVRQLEKRAMTKLRELVDGHDLEGLLNPEFSHTT